MNRPEPMDRASVAYLKQVDKLLKEGHLSAALQAIEKARASDPANPYIDAYEARVRKLIEDANKPHDLPPPEVAPASPDDDLIDVVVILDRANECIAGGDFIGALLELERAKALEPDNEDISLLHGQIQQTLDAIHTETESAVRATEQTDGEEPPCESATDAVVNDLVQSALGLTAEGAYDQALNHIMRGLELYPDHAILRDCGTLVIAGRQLSIQHMQTALCAADHARTLLDIERSRKEELARHVEIAAQHLRASAFDEALTEIALGFTVDPFSQELRELEQEVWKGKAETAGPEETHQPAPEVSRLVGLHILAAEEFARGNDFTAALDCLAKAYTIDPAHPDIKRAENRIRQQELRHRQQSEPPLKLVYHHERVANGL